jgi:hypothetical protein
MSCGPVLLTLLAGDVSEGDYQGDVEVPNLIAEIVRYHKERSVPDHEICVLSPQWGDRICSDGFDVDNCLLCSGLAWIDSNVRWPELCDVVEDVLPRTQHLRKSHNTD